MWCISEAPKYIWFSFSIVTDVNECEVYRLDQGGKLCVHECVNVPGSYHCSCPSGYKLLPDRQSCEGEWQSGSRGQMLIHRAQTTDQAGYVAPKRNICDLDWQVQFNIFLNKFLVDMKAESNVKSAGMFACTEISGINSPWIGLWFARLPWQIQWNCVHCVDCNLGDIKKMFKTYGFVYDDIKISGACKFWELPCENKTGGCEETNFEKNKTNKECWHISLYLYFFYIKLFTAKP